MSLSIPTPCQEDWNNMTPSEQGKFCAACAKEVVDFTSFSLPEIRRHLDKQKDHFCGRIYNTQLEAYNTRYQPMPSPSLVRKWAAAAVLTAVVAWPSWGQASDSSTVTPVASVVAFSTPSSASKTDSITLSGQVLEESGKSLGVVLGATVQVAGTDYGAVTDANGHFSITLPASGEPVVLRVSFWGYGKKYLPLVPNKDKTDIVFQINKQAPEDIPYREEPKHGSTTMGIFIFPD